MKTELIRTLDALETAIERERYREVPTLAQEVFEAYDRVSSAERIRLERAKAAAKRVQNEEVERYLDQMTAATLNRAGLSLGLGVGLPNPDEAGALLDSVVSVRNRETALADAERAVASALESVSVPARPVIGGVVPAQTTQPLGEAVSITASVVNAGDEPIDEVRIEFAGDAGFDPDSWSSTVDLAPRDVRDVSASSVPARPGRLDATVSIGGRPLGSERRIEVEVFDKGGYADRLAVELETLVVRVEEAGFQRNRERSLLRKADAAIAAVERAERALTHGDPERADDQLRTSSREIGAFINELDDEGPNDDGRSNVDVPSRSVASLIVIAEETIDTITDAIRAEVA